MSKSVKVRKKNRILHVESDRLAGFLKQGYDQIDEKGSVVKLATGGRSISLPEHNKALEEVEGLKKENASLKGQVTKLQNAAKEPKK